VPTGYTQQLANKDYDVKNWLILDVIRAMGCCVSLREAGYLSLKEMREQITGGDYYAKRVTELEDKIKTVSAWGKDEWQEKLQIKNEKLVEDTKQEAKKYHNEKTKLLLALTKTQQLKKAAQRVSDPSGVIGNTLDFACEQLNTVLASDYGGYEPYSANVSLEKNWERYKAIKLAEYHTDLKRALDSKAKEELRTSTMLKAFNTWVSFVEDNLETGEK